MPAFQRLYQGYGRLLRGCGLISSVATFLMMLVVVANIVGRYLFNRPLTGTLEFTESLLVIIIFLSIALTQYDGGHIRVNILTRRLPKRAARGFTVLAMLAGCAFFTWCAYAAWIFAAQSYSFKRAGMGRGGVSALADEIRGVCRHRHAGAAVPARCHRRDHDADRRRRRARHGEHLMGALELGLIGVIALFAAILAGINVMVALGAVGALGLVSVVGFHGTTSMLSTVFFETTHSFHFSVIPLFLLMGMFAMRAGLGEDLFDAANKWFGRLPGGLAISTTLGAAAFGAASGSSIGTATVFTKLALPQMLDRGYDKRLASASIAIAGTLAVMIPPSAVMVIFGILTNSSIGKLLIAGVIPGFLFAACCAWRRSSPCSAIRNTRRARKRRTRWPKSSIRCGSPARWCW